MEIKSLVWRKGEGNGKRRNEGDMARTTVQAHQEGGSGLKTFGQSRPIPGSPHHYLAMSEHISLPSRQATLFLFPNQRTDE